MHSDEVYFNPACSKCWAELSQTIWIWVIISGLLAAGGIYYLATMEKPADDPPIQIERGKE